MLFLSLLYNRIRCLEISCSSFRMICAQSSSWVLLFGNLTRGFVIPLFCCATQNTCLHCIVKCLLSSLFFFLLKTDSFLIQYILLTVSTPPSSSSPQLPLDPLPGCLSLKKNRLLRDNIKISQNEI